MEGGAVTRPKSLRTSWRGRSACFLELPSISAVTGPAASLTGAIARKAIFYATKPRIAAASSSGTSSAMWWPESSG
jgi:hypothetical protein